VHVVETVHGTKYIIDGELVAPNCRIIQVRTVWIRDSGKKETRFVTAYPREE
jgi:hypothetical protein